MYQPGGCRASPALMIAARVSATLSLSLGSLDPRCVYPVPARSCDRSRAPSQDPPTGCSPPRPAIARGRCTELDRQSLRTAPNNGRSERLSEIDATHYRRVDRATVVSVIGTGRVRGGGGRGRVLWIRIGSPRARGVRATG